MQLFAISEQADGRLVVTEGSRVLVSLQDDVHDLRSCLRRIEAVAGHDWSIVMHAGWLREPALATRAG